MGCLRFRSRRNPAAFVAVAIATISLLVVQPAAAASSVPKFATDTRASVQTPAGWNEPSGITRANGVLWTAFQNPNANPVSGVSSSTDGVHWSANAAYTALNAAKPEGDLGDVTMAADRAGDIFVGHLNNTLQTDLDYSTNGGATWRTVVDASSSPAAVDRPWISAYSPDAKSTDTKIYLGYHDFGPSNVWVVSCSMATGLLQCGAPVSVSNLETACNSIPGGVAVAPPGSPHAGRVYAVWSTADPLTNLLSGCNYTQLAPFYALFVAWSDTPAVAGSWHQAPVYVGPTNDPRCPATTVVGYAGTTPLGPTATCADVSEIFTPVAIDHAGNAYVSFVDFIDTLDPHYDVYVAHSTDGGAAWDGKADGSGIPTRLGAAGGTHFLPNLVAGDAGRVAVGYYATGYADRPYEAGDKCPTTIPPEFSCQGKAMPEPSSTAWVYDVSVSTNAARAAPSYAQVQASDAGVVPHYGDICNLGIYCDGSSTGNRSVFDSTSVYTDANGYIQAAWTDQRSDPTAATDAGSSNAQSAQVAYDAVYEACEKSGVSLLAKPGGSPVCAKT